MTAELEIPRGEGGTSQEEAREKGGGRQRGAWIDMPVKML